jgi:hypothetical protein
LLEKSPGRRAASAMCPYGRMKAEYAAAKYAVAKYAAAELRQ